MAAGLPTAHTTSGTAIAALGEADLDGALALVAEAGWNQVRADWQLFTELGAAFKVAGPAGELAATAAILPFAEFGWISMVLVAKAQRRRGIATALLEHCIARLRGQGLVPVLDATPAGRTVYAPLGFRDGWAITRWRRTDGTARPAVGSGSGVRTLQEHDWPAIVALDAAAFGADRSPLLRRLAARSRGFACVFTGADRVHGFLLGRDGRLATQIGPVIAQHAQAAAALLAHALQHVDGPVLVDVLDRHAGVSALLEHAGFAVERGYTRMALDADPVFGDAATTFAIAGPELG